MELKTINIDDYKPHPQNPHGHPDAQITALGKSIDDFDQYKNIVVWRGFILAGHGFAEAAKRKGITTLEAQDMSHLSEEQAKALMTADIVLPDLATLDNDLLSEVLAGFGDPLEIPGVDVDLLKSIDFGDYGGNGKGEDTPPAIDRTEELRVKWGTELGQLWRLGEHRLVCGDCTDRGVVDRVMGQDKADMVFTDPPYGMNLDTSFSNSTGNTAKGIRKSSGYAKVIGDDSPFDPSPLLDLFSTTKEQFYWGADYYRDKLPLGGSWLVWDKRATVENVKYSSSEFELCWSKAKHHRAILRVPWFGIIGTEQQDNKKRLHPTQKPLRVCTLIIDEYGGGVIVDPFLGSGTTLIACQNLNRKCRAIEISPAYVAVTLQRYADHTGETPQLMEEGG